MKTTVLAATLALLVGAPLVASATERVPASTRATVFICRGTTQYLSGCVPAAGQSARPRFIGPYEVRHGLLPNGLTPNPFTYG